MHLAKSLILLSLFTSGGLAQPQDGSSVVVARLETDWAAFKALVANNFWRPVDVRSLRATCDAAANLAIESTTSTLMSHEACIIAALRQLDANAPYYTASQALASDRAQIPPAVAGIGLEFARMAGWSGPIRIVRTYDGSSSQRAGLRHGDDILAIDGADVTQMDPQDVRSLLRGAPGTQVTLQFIRTPSGDLQSISVTRELLRPIRAYAELFPGHGVLFARVSQFSPDASLQLVKAIEKAQAGMPLPKRVVLDLRSNPGGLVDEAVLTASVFLPPKTVVFRETNKDGTTERRTSYTFDSRLAPYITDGLRKALSEIPLTVFVDEGCGPATEMLAIALKEQRRAVVIGKPTGGRDIIGRYLRLPSGAAVVFPSSKMTSAAGTEWSSRGVPIDEAREEEFAGGRKAYGDLSLDELLRYEVGRQR